MSGEVALQFQAAGALRPDSIYVERDADRQLLSHLVAGEFCFVLAPRQIGKSSLRVRTASALQQREIRCALIDLNQIGTQGVTDESWYFSLMECVADELGLPDPQEFWNSHRQRTPVHRWSTYLKEVVPAQVASKVVIFIDEIDGLLALPVARDDFFASIRALYDARAHDPACRQLTFCLLGVATPQDLMRDEKRTPFNIGKAIDIADFSWEEARALLPGLEACGQAAEALLRAVYTQTHGHPYMTQRLCQELVRRSDGGEGLGRADAVAAVVDQVFVHPAYPEMNLESAERLFFQESNSERIPEMLRLYRQILDERQRVAVQLGDPLQGMLRLTGMVAIRRDAQGPWLRPRNPIFATRFDAAWVLRKQSSRRLAEQLARWLEHDRSPDFVLRGSELDEAQKWLSGRRDVSSDERDFVVRSIEESRQEHTRRWLLIVLSVAVPVLLVLLGSVVLFFRDNIKLSLKNEALRQDIARLMSGFEREQEAGKALLARLAAADASLVETSAQRNDLAEKVRKANEALDSLRLQCDERQKQATAAAQTSKAEMAQQCRTQTSRSLSGTCQLMVRLHSECQLGASDKERLARQITQLCAHDDAPGKLEP